MSKTQLFRYINDLVRLEYVRITGGHINKGFSYQVSWWDHYTAMRQQVRQHLHDQLAALEAGTPGNASGTLEPATVL
ncbi:hypothetical protein ACFOTA_17785 [Chitinophaga sp. GCM10012297]|uniref:Uncharacterized protein n=1 Tax=Chitinophaga chungangae TaxID=2821488 RepID=A0ABS3YI21_9BACT|nr:hypothetical protein [Chitinophaga chungangae]MBO9154075.1 hypothetical protein [Chitinophaga chungangae]